MEYIKTIKKNPIAKKIKIVDIIHNADETRLDKITERDILRRDKYKEALKILRNEE